jgi:hypothetical protein
MRIVQAFLLAACAAAAGVAAAQLKPSGPGVLPLPPSAAEVQRKEGQAAKEQAARGAAEKWLALLDAREYGRAWDQGAKLFRERVERKQWVEALPKDRGALGALKSRRVEVSSLKTAVPGAPEGEYVTVRFSSSFDKKQDVEELVTMVFEDGTWKPLGYGLR